MRNEQNLLKSFLPKHEYEWDSRLLIDEAIKGKTEHILTVIAGALCGDYILTITHAENDNLFSHREDINTDDGEWVVKTTKYKFEGCLKGRDSGYVFYGNNKTQVLIKVIDFWAGQQSIFPCGGAVFPNSKAKIDFE